MLSRLPDEPLLDAVTALSGSGPAYVYLFVKALADAAVNEGLPRRARDPDGAARRFAGAEENMRMSQLAPAELIRIVASPGGTTEAALQQFAAAGFSDIVAAAVHAAADRSRELGRNLARSRQSSWGRWAVLRNLDRCFISGHCCSFISGS